MSGTRDDARKLSTKLEQFDELADDAVALLFELLLERRSDMIALARGRHVWGHFRYGDRNFAEWDADELRAAIVEELGDAIVYATRYLRLESDR